MIELQDGTSKKLDRILNVVLAKQSQDDGDTSSNNFPHFNKYGTAGDAQNKEVKKKNEKTLRGFLGYHVFTFGFVVLLLSD